MVSTTVRDNLPRQRAEPAGRRAKEAPIPCPACPDQLRATIQQYLRRVAILAERGFWTEVSNVILDLRERCLSEQPNTMDPFDVPIADTSIGPRARHQLATIGVLYVGQLAHVVPGDWGRLRIGPVRMARIRTVADLYRIKLQERRAA